MIKTGANGFFLEHKVQPHEGLFPIGRFYSVHPRHIAAYNNLDFNKGLAIGQIIRIPLSDTNFNQKTKAGIPVFFLTKEKETIANISIKNKMVPMNNLRQWNNNTTDVYPANTKLIVGFLVSNEVQKPVTESTDEKKENVVSPVEEKKEIKTPGADIKKELPLKVLVEPKKADTVIVKKESARDALPEIKEEKTIEMVISFFQDHFNEQIKQTPVSKDQTLTSSVFKSASGWQDAKYYLLINGVDPGTIIKITNPANGKIVFAKVLYGMDGIRQNQGLDMRISDAAAAALSVSETDKFILKVNY
jgi:hypothetical protein